MLVFPQQIQLWGSIPSKWNEFLCFPNKYSSGVGSVSSYVPQRYLNLKKDHALLLAFVSFGCSQNLITPLRAQTKPITNILYFMLVDDVSTTLETQHPASATDFALPATALHVPQGFLGKLQTTIMIHALKWHI